MYNSTSRPFLGLSDDTGFDSGGTSDATTSGGDIDDANYSLSKMDAATTYIFCPDVNRSDDSCGSSYSNNSMTNNENDVSPNDVPPNEVSPNDVSPNDVSPNDVSPNDVSPNDVSPNDVRCNRRLNNIYIHDGLERKMISPLSTMESEGNTTMSDTKLKVGFSDMDSETDYRFERGKYTSLGQITSLKHNAELVKGYDLYSRNKMQVFVKTLRGVTVTCDLSDTSDVGDLKRDICRKSGVPADAHNLTFKGKPLHSMTTRLSDPGIESRSSVQMMGRLPGG